MKIGKVLFFCGLIPGLGGGEVFVLYVAHCHLERQTFPRCLDPK